MDPVYAIPGAVALVEWILALVLYAIGWHRTRYELCRIGDGLFLAGFITALASLGWIAWGTPDHLALTRSGLASALAVSAVGVYAILARGRAERLSAAAMLGFAIPLQSYAVGRLWWGLEAMPPGAFLPQWMAVVVVIAMVGYGGLAVSAMMILLSFGLSRLKDELSLDQSTAAAGLFALEWGSVQVALVALSAALVWGLLRLWWAAGRIMTGDSVWALITWLLLAAGAYGLMQGAAPRRPVRALLVLACAAGMVAVLAMATPVTGAGLL